MEELGHKLKRAREERGVSLRDIAARTKISITALEALERSEFHRLPGGIFSRAVVRAYATEVGLDPDTTVENFLAYARKYEREAAERVAAARPGITRDDREFLERQRRAIRILRLAAVLLAVGAIGLLVWQVRRIWAPIEGADPAAASTEIASAPPPLPPPSTAAPPLTESPATAPGSPPGPEATPPPAARNAAEVARPEPETTPAAVVPVPAAADVAAALPTPVAPPLVVALTALADCLITVERDGGPAESQILRAGGRLRLDAERDVALTVADAGAVTWTINGRTAKPLGRAGAEVRVRITPANAAEFLP